MWHKRKVLVAGGTGLIGIPLVEMLLEQGAQVRVASLDDASRSHPDAEFQRLDLTVLENCRKVCRGMEYVFNLLGVKASPAVTAARPSSHYYSAVMMEHALLEGARLEGVSGFMLTSSIGVYAPAEVFYEDSVWSTFPSPNDWFAGWAKRAGELQVAAYKKEYGWRDITIVRPANVYGPWDNFDSENAMVVPSLIKRALSGSPELTVWGDGSPIRDFIHTRDVARGMMIIAEVSPDQPVNLGSGSGYSIRHLVDCILKNVAFPLRIMWDTSKHPGDARRVMDMKRARQYGFAPEISLEDDVREVTLRYAANKDKTNTRYDVFDQKG